MHNNIRNYNKNWYSGILLYTISENTLFYLMLLGTVLIFGAIAFPMFPNEGLFVVGSGMVHPAALPLSTPNVWRQETTSAGARISGAAITCTARISSACTTPCNAWSIPPLPLTAGLPTPSFSGIT